MTKLVGYGCSFTAGSEIVDHKFLGTTRTRLDQIKIDKGRGTWKEILLHFGLDHDPMDHKLSKDIFRTMDISKRGDLFHAEDLSRSLTWVRYLAEMRGHSHYKNRGLGGVSLEHCLFFIEDDINRGFIDLDKDEIIVQVPHPYRWMSWKYDGKFETISPNHLFIVNTGSNGNHEMNIHSVTWKMYQLLRRLDDMGIKFFFIEHPPQKHFKDLRQDNQNLDIDDWVEPFWNWVFDNCIQTPGWDDTDDKHGWGHYGTKTHYEIAEYLNDKLGN